MAGKLKVLTRAQIAQLSVIQNALEVLDWVLYDRLPVLLGGTATQFTFFQQAVGQAGITKDTTNLEIPGQLPAGHEFVCQKIIFEAQPNQAAGIVAAYAQDAVNLTHYGWGQFNIGSRPYLEAPLKNFIGGNLQGFSGVVTTAYAQSRTVVNGEMEYAPVIPANYSFNVQANYPAAPVVAADGFIRAQMIGKLIRPRQG